MALGALAAREFLLLGSVVAGDLDMAGHTGLMRQFLLGMHNSKQRLGRLLAGQIVMTAGSRTLLKVFLAVNLVVTGFTGFFRMRGVVELHRLLGTGKIKTIRRDLRCSHRKGRSAKSKHSRGQKSRQRQPHHCQLLSGNSAQLKSPVSSYIFL